MSAPNTIAEDLRALAEAAQPGPADLAERVLRRYRQRRSSRRAGLLVAAVATVAAVLVAVPAVLAKPNGGTDGGVAGIPPGPGNWRVPANSDAVPDAAQVWPGAVVELPDSPDGGRPYPLGSAGPHQVLVGLAYQSPDPYTAAPMTSLDIYDAGTGRYRQIAAIPAGSSGSDQQPWVSHSAVSAHRVYWGVDTAAGFDAYTVPLAGGVPQLLAHVAIRVDGVPPGTAVPLRSLHAGPWYATDSAVYWSAAGPGIVRLAAGGGEPEPVPGFADMYLLHGTSPWAVRLTGVDQEWFAYGPYEQASFGSEALAHVGVATRMKNLLTGATIEVSAPAGATGLTCAPDVCIGVVPVGSAGQQTEDGPTGAAASMWLPAEGPVTAFIQRPDGTDRVTLSGLPNSPDIYSLYPVGDRGFIAALRVVAQTGAKPSITWAVCDPLSGVAGTAPPGSDSGPFGDGALSYPDAASPAKALVWGLMR